jgi:hypothetical protein
VPDRLNKLRNALKSIATGNKFEVGEYNAVIVKWKETYIKLIVTCHVNIWRRFFQAG